MQEADAIQMVIAKAMLVASHKNSIAKICFQRPKITDAEMIKSPG